ncbi:MAG: bifunctional diaminohydroxyphosphoribosylaminopyrimidine deaminase/5-amino-6-(5-phosphoribosylamino)uracil reductase RibD [Candidatus Hydrogenedens sp.]|nr:bifunctional diaminohydroxyphosphoribosylaminopyrimidine deaminase/5-amino-6-(5-phosphoribosylamino)uracil reductase RibD [Candidatus Hydrogenedens sp.]
MGDDDTKHMARALALAARGRGRTSPNPMVGCVITRDGAVLGEGWHARAGESHAEVNAVRACPGGDIAGATVYVTLEPCAHEGRTPPCAPFLAERRPARVVAAMTDPNPLVSGRGLDILRRAGVAVETGILEAEARRLNEVFIKHITTGLPFVVAKCAMTLDGKIATRTGHSRWVSGEAARRKTHELRDSLDAIMVGSRTVMLDDPSLTTRLPGGGGRDPIRVILDAGEYLDGNRNVFRRTSTAPTWIATTSDKAYPFADDVLRVPGGRSGVDMRRLMQLLAERGVTSLLIEGGGATLASAFEAGVVDKVCFFIAPKIAGGRDAVTAVEGLGAATMDDAVPLRDMTVERVGEDLMVEAYVAGRGENPVREET